MISKIKKVVIGLALVALFGAGTALHVSSNHTAKMGSVPTIYMMADESSPDASSKDAAMDASSKDSAMDASSKDTGL